MGEIQLFKQISSVHTLSNISIHQWIETFPLSEWAVLILAFWYAEKYFDMKKNQCKEALEIYKTFLNRMTKLSEFLKVAEVRSVCPASPQTERRGECPSGANLDASSSPTTSTFPSFSPVSQTNWTPWENNPLPPVEICSRLPSPSESDSRSRTKNWP